MRTLWTANPGLAGRIAWLLLVVAASTAAGEAGVGEVSPNGFPKPGTLLSASEPGLARSALPPELAAKVAAGELSVRVGEEIDLPSRQAYREATEKYSGQVVLRDDGSLEGYVAGRPFPVLETGDPRCGLKAAWNLRHHDTGRGTEVRGIFRQMSGTGAVEREIEFEYVRAFGMHVAGEANARWEDEGILYKEFYRAIAPLDVRNLMNLRLRYDDDRAFDETWSYLPSDRRVRKTTQPLEESTMGSDLLREDYYGFSGYLHAHEWSCAERARVLAPVGIPSMRAALDPERYYPADPWRPRNVIALEAVPKTPGHPYGRRILYVDREMFTSLYVIILAPDGGHAKTLFTVYADPRAVAGQEDVQIPLWVTELVIDHRDGGATLMQVTEGRFDVAVPEERFGIHQMVAQGR